MAATTVDDLIDRTLRDWLVPPNSQPARFTLPSPITVSATTIPYTSAFLPPEAQAILSPGVVVEIDMEEIVIGGANASTLELENCYRGANGTQAVEHAAGSLVTISPPYSRRSIFEAIRDAISNLYPILYHLHTTTLTTNEGSYIEVPAHYITYQQLHVMSGTSRVNARMTELLNFPPSSTGKAIMVEGGGSGLTAYLTYRSKCHYPLDATEELYEDLGIEDDWHRILSVDAVAQLIQSRDIDASFINNLTARMDAEVFPPTSAASIHRSLLQYHEYLLERASRRLKARDGLPVTFNGRF